MDVLFQVHCERDLVDNEVNEAGVQCSPFPMHPEPRYPAVGLEMFQGKWSPDIAAVLLVRAHMPLSNF
jgi:hypothetical protein